MLIVFTKSSTLYSLDKLGPKLKDSPCKFLEKLAPNKPRGVKKYKDLIKYVKDRPGHDIRYAVSSKKIKDQLKWKPKENFSSGLRKTIEWYLNNLNWCKQIQKNNYNRERLGILHK